MESFVGTTRAAELKGVDPATVANWCRQGWIEGARKVGKTWLINTEELMTFTPPRTGPTRSAESTQAAIDEATKVLVEMGPTSWASWIMYMLEKLDAAATYTEFDQVLFALQDALTTRMDQGEW